MENKKFESENFSQDLEMNFCFSGNKKLKLLHVFHNFFILLPVIGHSKHQSPHTFFCF